MTSLHVRAVDGIGEITAGSDLVGLVGQVADLADGDVVILTSKIVSKAEGRVVVGDRDQAIAAESVRVVARRGPTSIVQTRIGLILAAAGVDASNVAPGSLVLLPVDPDGTARTLREAVYDRTGRNIAVIISDTAGRPWRTGQTDLAIGVAGLHPLEEFGGRVDTYGNTLEVTAPAVADELAGIAEVATGKLGARPLTVITGVAQRVLPPGSHGPGAIALIREPTMDMFGLGSREAVVAAVAGSDLEFFGSPSSPNELLTALSRCGYDATEEADQIHVAAPDSDPRPAILARAHGWHDVTADSPEPVIRLARLS